MTVAPNTDSRCAGVYVSVGITTSNFAAKNLSVDSRSAYSIETVSEELQLLRREPGYKNKRVCSFTGIGWADLVAYSHSFRFTRYVNRMEKERGRKVA